jgi:hypothetical protein
MGTKKRKPKPRLGVPAPVPVKIGPYIVRKRSSMPATGRYTTKYSYKRKWSVVSSRKMVHVVPQKNDWAIKVGGRTVSTHDTKADAVDQGKDIAKSAPLGQIVIHKQDGSIQTEHTYGKDAKRRRD